MVTGKAQIQQLVRQLFKLSLVDGRISSEQVAGILGYVEKHHPVNAVTILTAYQRLIATEFAKGISVVEHSGPVSAAVLASIATSLSARYQRPVITQTKANPALFAGIRVRIGDDLFESSVAGQLAALSASA